MHSIEIKASKCIVKLKKVNAVIKVIHQSSLADFFFLLENNKDNVSVQIGLKVSAICAQLT